MKTQAFDVTLPKTRGEILRRLPTKTSLSRLLLLGFAPFLAISALSAAEPQNANRFRLGPTLEEAERSEKGEVAPVAPAPAGFSQEEWNKVRTSIEEGHEPGAVQPVQSSTGTPTALPSPKPPPGLLQVDLPYESSLSVTGRKVIKLDISETHITQERADELGGRQDTQTFNMEQELQARIQGTVARKTTINVNFDDTKENVRDFSVVYKGDPDEVVQEAAFGDIVLSLPSTEFVNYNKQLFGIRTALKYHKFGLMAIGSRTKGTTETKRFTGATTRQQVFINDTAYIRRRFYDMTFKAPGTENFVGFSTGPMYGTGGPFNGRTVLPINGTNPEVLYVEDNTTNPQASFRSIAVATAPTTDTVSIRMRQMSPGVDYSIDRLRGIISFNTSIPEDSRIAVDFTLASGQRLSASLAGGLALLIKDRNPEPIPVSQELKGFYSAGTKNIVRDNGLGNFVFKVLDKDRKKEIGNSLSPIQRYPDDIEMKFETGIFEVKNYLPFPEVYSTSVNSGSPLQVVFSLEYQSVLRTYTLRPNIVLQSERVEVDGRKVARDIDYFIDYDVGIITFFNEDLIRESTVIECTYEFAPFGATLGETLVGARGTYDILGNKKAGVLSIDSWKAGTTVLYNFSAKPIAPPDVRSSPSSLLVTEGDTQLKGVQFGALPFKSNFGVEAARSAENPNLFGKAIIDSMEGIKQDDAAILLKDSWQPAANPNIVPFNSSNRIDDFRGRDVATSHLRWEDNDVQTTDTSDGSATQKALDVFYQLNTEATTVSEQESLVTILSVTGRDFTKKTTLEVEMEGAGASGAGVEMLVEYGQFNEDADGDNTLDTEDTIPFDATLNLGEDVGYPFNGPGPDLVAGDGDDINVSVGAGNARLNTEDLNGDRVLSTQDLPVFINKPLFYISATSPQQPVNDPAAVTDLSFTKRLLFQIPINPKNLNDEEKARLTSVKQIRVTLRNSNVAAKTGKVTITRLSMVGNTYEPATLSTNTISNSTMTVRAINNKDDSSYRSLIGDPAFNDLYRDGKPDHTAKEQALSLDYILDSSVTATTRNLYSAPRDFSKHDLFKFFLRRPTGAAPGGTFFMQVGSEAEYQQASIDVANVPDDRWLVVTLKQKDVNGDGTPDTWESATPGVTVSIVGNAPNLTQVAQLKMGVINATPSTVQGQLWVNEIHVAQPHERVGHAKRYTFDSSWTRWADFGGNFRDVDRNWQTPTTSVTNQDSTQQDAYINLNRLTFLPMSFKQTRDRTVTPSAFRSNANALVSFLEEGRVEHVTNASTAKLIVPKMPLVDFAYRTDDAQNTITQRHEYSDTVNVGASYSPASTLDLLPGPLTFRPLPNSMTYLYTHKITRLRFPGEVKLAAFRISTAPFSSTNVTQFLDENEGRLGFRPWDGFTFNPNYRLKVETERRDFRNEEILAAPTASAIDRKIVPRAQTQTVSASGNLRLLKWLDPRYSYSVSGTETNNLPTLTDPQAYKRKTIARNGDGELSSAIQVNQVLPKIKLVQSMNINTSYRLENGDTYNNVPDEFAWRSKLWIGNPLAISTGTRANLTDRRTFRTNVAWHPLGAYDIMGRLKPLKSMSLTTNFLKTTENSETTGTTRRTLSTTFPDLVLTLNDIEDMFGVDRVVDNSRLVIRNNLRKTNTVSVSRARAESWGTDYQFQFFRKYDVATNFAVNNQREDNLVTHSLTSKTDSLNYAVQARIPWRVWAFTPRYEHAQTESRDAVQITNDLKNDIFSVQIYGDIAKPVGIRFGRKEIGLANRVIVNSTVKLDRKRSTVNPATNYVDVYSLTGTADYTISQNFRLAVGGNFAQEIHHPDFRKLDKTSFGINSTLTIQF